jgi:hypothetical protein
MKAFISSVRPLMGAGGLVLGHAAAIAIGLVLMIAGIGMGVTIVLLPLGIATGITGLFIFLWGLLGSAPWEHDRPASPEQRIQP